MPDFTMSILRPTASQDLRLPAPEVSRFRARWAGHPFFQDEPGMNVQLLAQQISITRLMENSGDVAADLPPLG